MQREKMATRLIDLGFEFDAVFREWVFRERCVKDTIVAYANIADANEILSSFAAAHVTKARRRPFIRLAGISVVVRERQPRNALTICIRQKPVDTFLIDPDQPIEAYWGRGVDNGEAA